MSLVPRIVLGALDLTDIPYAIEFGYDLGAGQNVATEILSQLRDGEIISSDRTSNREATFSVIVEGTDFDALAEYEATLVLEGDKQRNLLTVDPGDGFGAPTVFETFRAQVVPVRDEDLEMANMRRYSVSIPARPFGRSENMVTVGSDYVSDTVTISDDCESTTGWSPMAGKSGNGYTPTFAVDSTAGNFVTGTSAVKVTPAPGAPFAFSGLSKQAPTAFAKVLSVAGTAGSYLTFAMRTTWPEVELQNVHVTSGAGRQRIAPINAGAVGNGFSRYALPLTSTSTITLLEVEVLQGIQAGDVTMPPLWVDSIGVAGSSSAAQKMSEFDVEGSARTEGTFAVAAPSGVTGLGEVLLYTTPDKGDGFRPDLKRWLVSGTTTPDSTAITGTYVTLESEGLGARTFEAPATSFRPGGYAVLARVKSNAGTTIRPVVKAQLLQGATLIGGVEATAGDLITLAGATDYEVVRLGVLHLPPTLPDALNVAAKIRFSVTDEETTTRLDELLVFPLEESALTWVKCGTGSPSAAVSSRLWLDGPSPEYPRGQLVVGTQAERTDARLARPVSRGSHLLYPGRMFSYLMASGSATAGMDVSYFPAWHTHARWVA